MFHRAPGSIGASSYPSRVVKGMRMGGHMGDDRVTVRNLKVVETDKDNNLLVVKGAVPGARGRLPPDPQRGLRLPERQVGGTEDTMGKLQVFDRTGQPAAEVELPDERFRLSREGPPHLRGRRQLSGQPAPGDRRDQDAERTSAAAARSPGGRRGRAGPARAAPARPSGERAARSSGRSPGIIPTSCPRRPAGTPSGPSSPGSSPTVRPVLASSSSRSPRPRRPAAPQGLPAGFGAVRGQPREHEPLPGRRGTSPGPRPSTPDPQRL